MPTTLVAVAAELEPPPPDMPEVAESVVEVVPVAMPFTMPDSPAAEPQVPGAGAIAPPPPPAAKERVQQLRVMRDHARCPKVACYKWFLLAHRLDRPRPTSVDLSELHLDPHLRDDLDAGRLELTVEAVTRRTTVNGRRNVVFVATRLTGVKPHGAAR